MNLVTTSHLGTMVEEPGATPSPSRMRLVMSWGVWPLLSIWVTDGSRPRLTSNVDRVSSLQGKSTRNRRRGWVAQVGHNGKALTNEPIKHMCTADSRVSADRHHVSTAPQSGAHV